MKVKYYRLADHPNFNVWWQQWLNPGVDPYGLTLDDTRCLYHMEKNGQIVCTTARLLIWEWEGGDRKYNNGTLTMPEQADPKLAWSYAAFRDIYEEEQNPGIVATGLLINDSDTVIKYKETDGSEREAAIHDIFEMLFEQGRLTESYRVYAFIVCKMYKAVYHPEFLKWWQAFTNPGVDLAALYYDDPRMLYHVTPDGWILETTAADLIRQELWESSFPETEKAWYYAAFRKIYDPDINTGINVARLRPNDKQAVIRYRTSEGGIGSATAYDLFSGLLEKNMLDELSVVQVFTKLHMYKAMYHPLFREWYQQWMNPGVDPYSIYTHEDRQLYHAYPDGRLQSVSALNIITKKRLIDAGRREPYNAWSYAIFRERYDPDLNPEIFVIQLRINDADTVLKMREPDGTVTETTARSLFQRFYEEGYLTEPNDIEAMKTYGIYKGIYDPAFRQWVQAWMNPHVDIENVCFGDDVLLYHAHDDGRLQTIDMRNASRIQKWDAGHKDPMKAWSYKVFRMTFPPELNPDVDIMQLRIDDPDTVVRTSGDDGTIEEITVKALFERFFEEGFFESRDAILALNKYSVCKAVYDEGFRRWFQPWMNPGIDKDTLCFGEDVDLYHAYDDGRLQTVNMRDAVRIITWDGGSIDPFKAWSYAAFREIFSWELNPDVDIMELDIYDRDTAIRVSGADGAIEKHVARELFEKLYQEGTLTEKYGLRIFKDMMTEPDFGKWINAIAIDETISIYVRSEKDREALKMCNVDWEYPFTCPFCGLDFTKKIRRMVNVSPKCQYCGDEGGFGQYNEAMLEGAYISRKRGA